MKRSYLVKFCIIATWFLRKGAWIDGNSSWVILNEIHSRLATWVLAHAAEDTNLGTGLIS